ncbi:tetratricopeptide repeat-containing diguanylate cyclase [Photobacterium rosenbergii]|uniref:diguanylate cyclase n=1 Tax=Photobacterium rosenbergii TaxID=294936 RepID=A0ABU3ZEC7_9GAMM|nr:tetratricopeptide repeat-containing diguanylate cyclase [Photobacterium rosenbergii]MDV5168457.1 tetratricopeptide repeat-containing diguanylate cyclase [Photobacterium rosenbergii]
MAAGDKSALQCYLSSKVDSADNPFLNYYNLSWDNPSLANKQNENLQRLIEEGASYNEQALYWLGRYNIEQAEDRADVDIVIFIDQLEQVAQKSGEAWMDAEVMFLDALTLMDQREYALAQVKLESVKLHAEQIGYQLLLARSLKWLANIDVERSNYNEALDNYQAAYEIFSSRSDNQQLARLLSNIASVYINMEEWETASHYSQRAFEWYGRSGINNAYVESILHINAGVIDKYLGNERQRKFHVDQTLKLSAKTRSVRIKTIALINLSAYYLDHGDEPSAMTAAEQCLVMARRHGGKNGISAANCNESLSEAFYSSGRADQALYYAKLALAVYESNRIQHRMIYVYELLAKIYESRDDYQQALQYYKKYSELGRSYLFDIRRKELFDMQERYDTHVKEKEIQLLKAENALTSSRLAERKASENMLKLGTALIIILLYWLYRRYSMLNKDKQVLEQSNAQLETQSNRDPLTMLHNRRFLERWLKNMPIADYRHGGLVVVIDIDHFKKFNDDYGHNVGDEVLVEMAKRLKAVVRQRDVVVRWGGEEFIMVVSCRESESERVLQRIQRQISAVDFSLSCGDYLVTVSMGAIFTTSAAQLYQEWVSLLLTADRALYQVKASGRNNYNLSTSYQLSTSSTAT